VRFLIALTILIFCIFVYNVVTYIRSAVWGMRRKAQEKELRRIEPEPEPDDASEYAYRAATPEKALDGSEVRPDETTRSSEAPSSEIGQERTPEAEDTMVA